MAEDTASTFGKPEMMDAKQDSSGNSTGKAIPLKSRKKEVPHYLRASTGSCHDLCKYGRKHIPEEKPWRLTPKKTVKKAPDISNQTLKKTLPFKKKNVTDDACEIIKREVVNSPSDVPSKLKQKALIKSAGDETLVKQKKKTLTSKLESTPVSGSYSSRNVDILKPKVLSKSYSALAIPKSKGAKVTNEKVASSVLKPQMVKDNGVNRKNAASLRGPSKVSLTPKSLVSPSSSLRQGGNSSLRKSQSLKAASSAVPNQKPRNVKRTEELKELDGYPVEEKTLHIVEMETKSKVSEHDQNQECIVEPSPPPLSPSTQEDEDQKEYDVYTVSEAEEYEYPSGSNESESAEEGVAAQKLQIRKGKGAGADSVYDGPRKLKFRSGRDLGEEKEQNSQVRRSFKKRDEIIEEETNSSGEQVVLRHQDVQERDAQVLSNNVIEETASKLVEARKSKVKALVGAFETVISLQESKPPANSST